MPKFDWKEYITVSDSFSPADKAAIEKSLNEIAAAEPDGPALLKQVFTNNPKHEKFQIAPAVVDKTGENQEPSNQTIVGSMSLAIAQSKASYVQTENGYEQVSLNGILVHELFHAADFNNRADVKREKLVEALVSGPNLTFLQKEELYKAYVKVMHDANPATQSMAGFGSVTSRSAEGKQGSEQQELLAHKDDYLQQISALAGIPKDQFTLPHFPSVDLTGDKKDKKSEIDATEYTDVFMAKFFPGEPWRGVYSNDGRGAPPLTEEQKKMELLVRELGCGKNVPYFAYSPESATIGDLGQLSQPTISQQPSPGCPVPQGRTH